MKKPLFLIIFIVLFFQQLNAVTLQIEQGKRYLITFVDGVILKIPRYLDLEISNSPEKVVILKKDNVSFIDSSEKKGKNYIIKLDNNKKLKIPNSLKIKISDAPEKITIYQKNILMQNIPLAKFKKHIFIFNNGSKLVLPRALHIKIFNDPEKVIISQNENAPFKHYIMLNDNKNLSFYELHLADNSFFNI